MITAEQVIENAERAFHGSLPEDQRGDFENSARVASPFEKYLVQAILDAVQTNQNNENT